MKKNGCTKPRSQICRAGSQIPHLFIKSNIQTGLNEIIQPGSHLQRLLQIQAGGHALNAKMIFFINHNTDAAIRGNISRPVLRIFYQISADQLLFDQHFALKRSKALHIRTIKRLSDGLLYFWKDTVHFSQHFGQLTEIRAVGEGLLTKVSGQPDPAGQNDIMILTAGLQPGQIIFTQQIIH